LIQIYGFRSILQWYNAEKEILIQNGYRVKLAKLTLDILLVSIFYLASGIRYPVSDNNCYLSYQLLFKSIFGPCKHNYSKFKQPVILLKRKK